MVVEVLADKRTSKEAKTIIRESESHNTEEAGNTRGGKDSR